MFIAGEKSLPVPVGCRGNRMWVLHRRSRGSTNRVHNVVLLTKKYIDIRILELDEKASHAINRSMDVRVVGKVADIGTLNPIQDRI